jgi:hypothetical protein
MGMKTKGVGGNFIFGWERKLKEWSRAHPGTVENHWLPQFSNRFSPRFSSSFPWPWKIFSCIEYVSIYTLLNRFNVILTKHIQIYNKSIF